MLTDGPISRTLRVKKQLQKLLIIELEVIEKLLISYIIFSFLAHYVPSQNVNSCRSSFSVSEGM